MSAYKHQAVIWLIADSRLKWRGKLWSVESFVRKNYEYTLSKGHRCMG